MQEELSKQLSAVPCRYVGKNRWLAAKEESVVDLYSNPGSRVYAPLQRAGRFPDSSPNGKAIESEHFVPTSAAGLEALEKYLPKAALDMTSQVRRPLIHRFCHR